MTAWLSHKLTAVRVRARRQETLSYDLQLAIARGWASVGPGTYGYPRLLRYNYDARLAIGAYTSIAVGSTFMLGGQHRAAVTNAPLEWILGRRTVREINDDAEQGSVTVGSDVWIGFGAIVLPGATIGDGAIVGAGTVVRGHVPPYAIVTGNPGKVRRYRFEADVVAALCALRWWDWPREQIAGHLDALLSPDAARILSGPD